MVYFLTFDYVYLKIFRDLPTKSLICDYYAYFFKKSAYKVITYQYFVYICSVNQLVYFNIDMKKQILDALKAKFEGVSDAILSRIAEKLAKTVTTAEQVATAVEGVTIQQVIESYGDSRATEAQSTAVHTYEQKYGLKDGQKVNAGGTLTGGQEPPKTEPAGGDDTPKWAIALLESNKQLTERMNRMEGERITTTRRQQLSGIYSKLPEAFRKPYERISVDNMSDEQFNTLVADVTTEVDNLAASINAKGAVFGKPSAQHGGTGNEDALTEEQEKAIAHRDGIPAKDQQPF